MNVEITNLSFHYPSNQVLDDVMFSVGRKECVVILGTNGVGKSTLLKCMNRILRYQSGSVYMRGDDICSLSRNELAKRVGYVAQSSLFSETTVFDAILLGRKPYIKWDITDADLKLVQGIMERLSLSQYAMRTVTHLSGGETQKVAIARALAQQPEILLFDEPTSNLDLKNQLEVISLIKSIVKEGNVSAVVTMHDLNLALRFADKFIMMKGGRIYAAGGREILTSENIKAVYDVDVVIEQYREKLVIIPH
jgi:iron complex transport system ATP-binding protein